MLTMSTLPSQSHDKGDERRGCECGSRADLVGACQTSNTDANANEPDNSWGSQPYGFAAIACISVGADCIGRAQMAAL